MKKSIQFLLLMAIICAGNSGLIAQEQNKNHLEQILIKYDCDIEVANRAYQKDVMVRVDSIVSTYPESDFEKEKQVKTYYDDGKLQTHTYIHLFNNEWENSSRYVNYYNEDGKILERLYELWEEEQWLTSSKTSYIYYDYGKVQTKLTEKYINGSWENDRLSLYNWDSNYNFAELLSQRWEDNEWVNRYIINTTNNEYGWYLVDVIKLWEENEWVKSDSTLYGYDDYGNNSFVDSKIWQENEWVNGNYRKYRYDSEQRQTSSSSLMWSENVYTKQRMDSTVYNENDLVDSKLFFYGNDENEWENDELETRVYDENLNLIEHTIQLWEDEQWNNGFYANYSFEEGLIEGMMQEWIDGNWELSTQFGYLYFILEGEQVYRGYGENTMQVYYSDMQVGIKNPSEITSNIQAYPNPTTGIYHIKMLNDNIKTIEVYQLNSQLIASYQLNGDEEFQLELSDMPNGIYMIKVQSENHTTVLKTVKSN